MKTFRAIVVFLFALVMLPVYIVCALGDALIVWWEDATRS